MSTSIKVNLEADLRHIIMQTLPYDYSNSNLQEELNNKTIEELTQVYFNWTRRLVSDIPREVYLSEELAKSPKRATFQMALDEIIDDLQRGRPITERLSKQIVKYGYAEKTNPKRPDLDLLLNDWGVHHLHLGKERDKKDPRFVNRLKELLFVIFKHDKAFLIDIFDHKSWTNKHVVEITVRNWPQENLFPKLIGVLPPLERLDESDHKKIRHSGLIAPIEIDGELYIPTGLMSTAGTSFFSGKQTDELLRSIRYCEYLCRTSPAEIQHIFAENRVPWPENPTIELILFPHGFYVVEKSVNFFIPVVQFFYFHSQKDFRLVDSQKRIKTYFTLQSPN